MRSLSAAFRGNSFRWPLSADELAGQNLCESLSALAVETEEQAANQICLQIFFANLLTWPSVFSYKHDSSLQLVRHDCQQRPRFRPPLLRGPQRAS